MAMTPTDERSFADFVRARGDALLRYARLLIPDPAEAEDALQVALMRVVRHWPKRLEAPEAYVRAAILNVAKDRSRRRHLVPVPAEPAQHSTDEERDHGEAIAAGARLERLLQLLPPRQRTTVVLRVIEGLTEAETAAAMDCSAGTVKSNLARGLDKIRDTLAAEMNAKEGARR
jgi:RNA polymerase sigma factor (sigma-70 family)